MLGRLRLLLAQHAQAAGDLILSPEPHFLWVTEFPLFTRADPDKDFLAQGRWSSSHHPFTAPMWEDIDKMYAGRLSEVRLATAPTISHTSLNSERCSLNTDRVDMAGARPTLRLRVERR